MSRRSSSLSRSATNFSGVTTITAGEAHSLVIKLGKPSHLLFGTGSNQNGELGLGDYNDRDYWDDD